MHITKEQEQAHSEEKFADELMVLSDAGAAFIHVTTPEVPRALMAARKRLITSGNTIKEWSIVSGMAEVEISNMTSTKLTGNSQLDLGQCLADIAEAAHEDEASSDDHYTYYIFANPHFFFENNVALIHQVQMLSAYVLPSTNIKVIMITPEIALPDELKDYMVTLPFATPSHRELLESFDSIIEDVDENMLDLDGDDKRRICHAGAGLSKASFELCASKALVVAANRLEDDEENSISVEDIVEGIYEGKTDLIRKSDLLELYPATDIDEVGGMDNLKNWLIERQDCFSEEAAEAGVEPPRGLVIVGVPGTGKSLIAKAAAGIYGVPLLRLDFGRLFNSLLGSSEQRARKAFELAEALSPCVLFADEIDKGLGGAGGSGDSGASSRVLGTYLTWVQECKAPVFNIASANNITHLPPELTRKGRFDAIFSTGLPNKSERKEVLRIHLAKRKHDLGDYTSRDISAVLEASKAYISAEIEAAVKDALVKAYNERTELTMQHIVNALKAMVPLSTTYRTEILEMVLWCSANTTPASISYEEVSEEDKKKVTSIGSRKVRTRKRHTDED